MPGEHDAGDANQPPLSELITLSQAADYSGLSAGHLRLLVRREEMWGIKMGRNWFTTKSAVDEYLALDRRPGPKPTSPTDS